jgi:hypothetical protein
MLNAMKENIELLTGQRGERDDQSKSVLKSDITIRSLPAQQAKQITAQGQGFTVNGVPVPSLDDYTKLVQDMQSVISDVTALRQTIETLITQLRG